MSRKERQRHKKVPDHLHYGCQPYFRITHTTDIKEIVANSFLVYFAIDQYLSSELSKQNNLNLYVLH